MSFSKINIYELLPFIYNLAFIIKMLVLIYLCDCDNVRDDVWMYDFILIFVINVFQDPL